MLVISAKGRELEAALKEARLPERSHRMLMSRACLNFQAGGGPSTLVEQLRAARGLGTAAKAGTDSTRARFF